MMKGSYKLICKLILISILSCVKSISQNSFNRFKFADTIANPGSKLVSKAVVFDAGKSTLKQGSIFFLDSLVNYLNKFPSIKLEVQNFGKISTPSSATSLPLKRAEAICDYLVYKGISKDRLHSLGLDCVDKKTTRLKCDLRTEFLLK